MGNAYKIRDKEGLYFVTFTIVGWADVFTRQIYRDCILDSFRYCIQHKGLNVHAYVIMSNHLHAILSAKEGEDLPSIIRDLKKFTSKAIVKAIQSGPESRRAWLLDIFRQEAQRTQRGQDYIVWQEGYHAKQLITNPFLNQKLSYIHNNPVKAGWVSKAEDYVYSSARNYAGEMGLLHEIDLL
ncbi:REP-associated tyrosine transposase [Catalinimonas niigatensis]|uniref:REP-associated tyrosine transposase n=1 Tax=Catalinimonas niigatensis TaxID=1397264 RepID=UPI00266547F1|nr:transposase [Catalinimonas niigatensis]WPP49060.1 transposase [Catalinimonas niigatensis]